MQICRSGKEIKKLVQGLKADGHTVGFVPTMGALHAGHLSLVEEARIHTDRVVASIYVNPTQFNNPEDLKLYPRDLEGDSKKFEASGVSILFIPEDEDMYPDGAVSEAFDLGHLDNVMEGAFRPGHFQGVATVVKRLFKMIEPDYAFFGEKDYQQVAVIRKMVKIEDLDTQVISCPNIREQDGLAMSSRNLRLNAEERQEANLIYASMKEVKDRKEELSVQDALALIGDRLRKSKNLSLEYVQIADEKTLEPLENWSDSNHERIFIAAYAGKTRLIDNLSLR